MPLRSAPPRLLALSLVLAGCPGETKESTTDEPTTSGSTTTDGTASSSSGSSSTSDGSSSSTGAPTTTEGSSSTGAASAFGAVQAIFNAKCSCHLGPPSLSNGQLELSEGVAYANLVGVPSPKATMTNRVEAGDPAASYLYLKLTGDYLTVPGGTGDPMPLIGGPLSDTELMTIEAWILAGAPNDG